MVDAIFARRAELAAELGVGCRAGGGAVGGLLPLPLPLLLLLLLLLLPLALPCRERPGVREVGVVVAAAAGVPLAPPPMGPFLEEGGGEAAVAVTALGLPPAPLPPTTCSPAAPSPLLPLPVAGACSVVLEVG